METLPLHCATADEALPPLGNDPIAGPDLVSAAPVSQMLEWLSEVESEPYAYLRLWRALLATVGVTPIAGYERDGSVSLMAGAPCDLQMRHRSRYAHILFQDLDRLEGRRDLLTSSLLADGFRFDARPSSLKNVFSAVRGYLRHGGRIMIGPDKKLIEGGVSRQWIEGTPAERAAIAAAGDAYHSIRRRPGAEACIRRAVKILGLQRKNGWQVLEARS